jgi:hypothetical protein
MIQIALFNLHFIKQTLCNLTDVFPYIKYIRLPAKIVFRFLKSESSSSPTKKKETLITFLKENSPSVSPLPQSKVRFIVFIWQSYKKEMKKL